MTTPADRPPGDRTPENELRDLIAAVREELALLRNHPPVVELKQSWWDQIADLGPSLSDGMYMEYQLPGNGGPVVIYLRIQTYPDGIELTIRNAMTVIWQRKLFYQRTGGPRT